MYRPANHRGQPQPTDTGWYAPPTEYGAEFHGHQLQSQPRIRQSSGPDVQHPIVNQRPIVQQRPPSYPQLPPLDDPQQSATGRQSTEGDQSPGSPRPQTPQPPALLPALTALDALAAYLNEAVVSCGQSPEDTSALVAGYGRFQAIVSLVRDQLGSQKPMPDDILSAYLNESTTLLVTLREHPGASELQLRRRIAHVEHSLFALTETI